MHLLSESRVIGLAQPQENFMSKCELIGTRTDKRWVRRDEQG